MINLTRLVHPSVSKSCSRSAMFNNLMKSWRGMVRYAYLISSPMCELYSADLTRM